MITAILGTLVVISVLLPCFYYCLLDHTDRPKLVTERPKPNQLKAVPVDTSKMRGAVKQW